ncbi:MAG: MFS transporter, partial [Gammaproteobacteria bacterium]
MPIYIERLGGSNVMAGLFWGSFTTASTGVRPVAGRLLDFFSRRTVFLVGLPIMILSVLSYRWTSSMTVLLVLGFTQGLGFGSTNTAAGTIAADLIPKPRLGEGMGFFALAATTAMALGPVTGLFIITRLSFSTLFYVSAATSCCAFVLGYLIRYRSFHRQDPDRMRDPVSNEPRRMSVFELRAVGPSLVMFFTNTVFGAVVTFIALYALEEGITNIGPFFTVYAVALALTRPLSGIVSDRLGTDVVVVPGLVLVAASMVLLSYANTLSIFLGAGIIFGLG